ncbi:hypothetical protein TD95_000503 [Thielaviopsis punctulata]|uniref:NDT80 domain-containing protein n=1 Tax=Thielaviopsis punctulata TaxID=72032 RepID=A0A0F4ZA43_9PEZI|nr:hypothetical protein TD95_000503 [Thielaviopsis punctulata]
MTAATASYASMADLKSEHPHPGMWSNFPQTMPMSSRYPGSMDGGLSRPRHHVDLPPPYPAYHSQPPSACAAPRSYHDDEYERSQAASLPPQQQQQQQQQQSQPPQPHSYQTLKRPYSATESASYTEIVQDLRDDGSKLNVGHDQKLLSFKRNPDKHTIVDQHGRIHTLDMNAQLHGMFFLSEMPTTASDGTQLQAELTCYRRNLFQISGSLICPRGQLNVVTDSGETVPVSNMEVTISAIESVDGNAVRLIVIPWKTPPPNTPEVAQTPDQEPPTLPLIPFQDEGNEGEGEFAVYPIGWRRLQFRIATANNGRRKELQQHFVLHLKVIATLANGTKAPLAECITSPIVVRGRSPRNFQARKEIPLLGSSAGSRGQALVENGIGIVAGPLAINKPDNKRSIDIQPPRSAFTFNPPKLPNTPMSMRSNSYPSWPSSGMSQMPPTPSNYPPTSMSGEHYPKVPLSGASGFSTDPQEMSVPSVQLSLTSHDQGAPIRTQYAYAPASSSASQLSGAATTDSSLSVPRYVDSNPRPTKSPRHNSQTSATLTTPGESAPEYRYGSSYHDVALNTNSADFNSAAGSGQGESSAPNSAPARDYYPPASTWTSSGESSAPTSAYATDGRSYSFDAYKTGSAPPPPPKGPVSASGAPVYSGANYSWSQ